MYGNRGRGCSLASAVIGYWLSFQNRDEVARNRDVLADHGQLSHIVRSGRPVSRPIGSCVPDCPRRP
jgi:hypothetical protein